MFMAGFFYLKLTLDSDLAQFLPEKCTKDLNPAPQKLRNIL